MERKGWIAAGLGALIVVGGVAFFALRGEEKPVDGRARIEAAAAEGGGGSAGGGLGTATAEGGEPSEPARGLGQAASAYADAGVALESARLSTRGRFRRDESAEGRSAGWRLGRTRARIELAETRVAQLREAVANFENNGEDELAERQRAVLRRFENRLASLRQEEVELEAEATREGSLGDVEQGAREGLDARERDRRPASRIPPSERVR